MELLLFKLSGGPARADSSKVAVLRRLGRRPGLLVSG
jgi:hypothetical protein